ncbi:MAG: Ig domain-containing protein, partial [Bryobacteraceae bacterium]
ITPATLTAGLPGTAFSQTFTAVASSGAVTWSIASGSLPPGLTLNTSTGVISGTPTTLGEYRFTLRWADSAGNSFSRDFTLAIGARLSFASESRLPPVSAGANYEVPISASGGAVPYRFAVTGGLLPAGLTLDPTGRLSGAARNEGSYRFTVTVTDNAQATATREFSLEVGPPLVISTGATLPAATYGQAISIELQATGAQPPYLWRVTAGALPGGVSVSPAGLLSGTPQAAGTFRFTVEVIDNSSLFRAQTSREFTLVVQPPAVSPVSVTGASDTVQPAQQPVLGVEIASAYPLPLAGTLTLTFVPDAVNPADDPSVQFLPRGRTLDFTIPADALRAEFAAPATIQTGTVAGEIRIAVALTSGGVAVTPAPPPRIIRVNRSAPVIRSVSLNRTATGFDVVVTGYSTPRDGIASRFRFESSGGNLTTPEVNVQSNALFTGHFTSQSSVATGGTFQYIQSFSVTGDFGILRFVEVTLTNTVAASQPMRASF